MKLVSIMIDEECWEFLKKGIEVYEKQTEEPVSIPELVKKLVTDYLEDSYVDYASDDPR